MPAHRGPHSSFAAKALLDQFDNPSPRQAVLAGCCRSWRLLARRGELRQAGRMSSDATRSIGLVAAMQLLAALAIGLVAGLRQSSYATIWELMSYVVSGTATAGICLAVLWAAAGTWPWLLRVVAAAALSSTFLFAQYNFYRNLPSDAFLLGVITVDLLLTWVQVLAVFIPLFHCFRFRLRHLASPESEPSVRVHLWHLMALIALVAVWLGVGRVLLRSNVNETPFEFSMDEWGWILTILLISVTCAVVAATLGMIAALAVRFPVRLTVAGIALVAVLSWVELKAFAFVEHPVSDSTYVLASNFSAFFWAWLSAHVLRWGGWRLMSPPPLKLPPLSS